MVFFSLILFSSSELSSFAHVSAWLAKWAASYGVRLPQSVVFIENLTILIS